MTTPLNELNKLLELESLKLKFKKLLNSNTSEAILKNKLINCLLENNIVVEEIQYTTDKSEEQEEQELYQPEFKEDIYRIRDLKQQKIDVPTNKTSIIINGKKINIDLVKVSTWTIERPTKQLRLYKNGAENIKSIINNIITEQNINQNVDKITETALSLYWNITIYHETNEFKNFKSKETKLIYQLLSILYGIIYTIGDQYKDYYYGLLLKEFQLMDDLVRSQFLGFKNLFKDSFIAELFETDKLVIKTDIFDNELILKIMDIFIESNILPKDIYTFGAIAFYISKNKKMITLKTVQDSLELSNTNRLRKYYNIVHNYSKTNQTIQKIIKKY